MPTPSQPRGWPSRSRRSFAEAHSTLGFTLFQGQLDARGAREPFELSRRLGTGSATVLGALCAVLRTRGPRSRCSRAAALGAAPRQAQSADPPRRRCHRIRRAALRGIDPPMRQALSHECATVAGACRHRCRVVLTGQDRRGPRGVSRPSRTRTSTGWPRDCRTQRWATRPAAQAAFDELTADHGERVLYQQAQVLAQWGDRTGALTRLDQAWQRQDSGLIYLRNDPMLDSLRSEPEFMTVAGVPSASNRLGAPRNGCEPTEPQEKGRSCRNSDG